MFFNLKYPSSSDQMLWLVIRDKEKGSDFGVCPRQKSLVFQQKVCQPISALLVATSTLHSLFDSLGPLTKAELKWYLVVECSGHC